MVWQPLDLIRGTPLMILVLRPVGRKREAVSGHEHLTKVQGWLLDISRAQNNQMQGLEAHARVYLAQA